MVSNYSTAYCRALVAASPKDMLTDYGHPKFRTTLNSDELARMQREMETLQKELANHEDTYGQNFLNLVIVRGYLSKLLDNGRVVRFLSANHSDILDTFQQIVESTSLEG
ncbi:MAG: plasmid partitioning protein RepB C-terminal domain-containing protein [Armatimonadota bacterium]